MSEQSGNTEDGDEVVPIYLERVSDSDKENMETERQDGEIIITNWDELEIEPVARGFRRKDIEGLPVSIMQPGDALWSEELASIDPGEEIVLGDQNE